MWKLVRDRVPELIGAGARVRYAGECELALLLVAKLVEEVAELLRSPSEEAADVLEVVDSLIEALGLDRARVLEFKARKRAERGGFSRGVLVELPGEGGAGGRR